MCSVSTVMVSYSSHQKRFPYHTKSTLKVYVFPTESFFCTKFILVAKHVCLFSSCFRCHCHGPKHSSCCLLESFYLLLYSLFLLAVLSLFLSAIFVGHFLAVSQAYTRCIYAWRYMCHNTSACSNIYIMWAELNHGHFSNVSCHWKRTLIMFFNFGFCLASSIVTTTVLL